MPKGQNIAQDSHPHPASEADGSAGDRRETPAERTGITEEMRAHGKAGTPAKPKAAPTSDRHDMEQAFTKATPPK